MSRHVRAQRRRAAKRVGRRDPAGAPAPNPVILRLERNGELSPRDLAKLAEIAASAVVVEQNADLVAEGARSDLLFFVLDGFLGRYKVSAQGGRLITAYLTPGDSSGVEFALQIASDHGLTALTRSTVAKLSRQSVEELKERHPRIFRALLLASLVDTSILRQWLFNMGRMPADERLAHLLCELLVRLQAVGRATDRGFILGLTHEQLADTLGITPVHVNRTIQRLRRNRLVDVRRREVVITDVARLGAFSSFCPSYLFIDAAAPNGGGRTRREPKVIPSLLPPADARES